MNIFFTVGVALALGFIGLCGYWYMNPHRMPQVLRGNVPQVSFPKPNSPMQNFSPPKF
jgi:hypothetical protein